jgi:putative endopeptidase
MNKAILLGVLTLTFGLNAQNETALKSIDTNYMDKNISPKEDFFLFSNNNWIKNNPIPASESRWGSFNELEKSNNEKLTKILEDAKNNPGEKGSLNQLLGDYYASFTDMKIRNEKGISPIQKDIDRINSIKSRKEILTVLSELHIDGVSSAFGFGVDQDLMNITKHISYFFQGGIGLPNCEYYTKEDKKEILNEYEKYVSTIFQLMDYKVTEANEIAKSIIEFEKDLAQSMMTKAELRVPEDSYFPFSKNDLNSKLKSFDLESYLSLIGSYTLDTIVVGQPKFVEKIADKFENETIENWKNYLLWSTVNHYASHLSQPFIDAKFKFYAGVLSGKKEMKPTTDRAINEITQMEIGELLGKAFVKLYFSQKAQDKVNTMVDNLLIVFEERISNLEWMTDETKTQASHKLTSIGRKLGFPSEWEDFSSLNFSSAEYVSNIKEMNLYNHKKNMADLDKDVDKNKWGMPAHMVNAYYHPLLNEIAFPAGIMQPPFFDENAEDAVNYGSIGMVIGHEFTHGFDDMGSKFDAEGNFRNWWSEEDLKMFEERTKTLGETFSGFCPIDGHCVNPDLTMGENIADLGGLTMAYYAYALTDEFKSGKLVNGYTPAQRFFIAYAQLWKINYTDKEMKNRIANDAHSPGMYRVNGPLMNSPEFFEAFQVQEGDQMRNPEGKVAKIW